MQDTALFVLTHIICPFIATVIGGLAVVYHKKIWAWLATLTMKMFSPLRKGLGIEELNKRLNEIEATALYTIIEQMEMDERIAKLEAGTHNPDSPSSETEDKES